jgi:Glycosyl transferase family 11
MLTSKKGAYSHGISLRNFRINFDNYEYLDTPFDTNRIKVRTSNLIPKFIKSRQRDSFFTSKELGFDPNLFNLSSNSVLIGYFQSYKYFEYLNLSSGKSLSILPNIFTPKFRDVLEEIKESNPIAVHVRRGDYIGNRITGILSGKYYENALEVLNSPKRKVWVFSDDPSIAKEMFCRNLSHEWKFVDNKIFVDTSEAFYALSMFSDIVIANSTFSWWAATLNQKSNVIAPNKWFINGIDPADLLFPDWIQIQSEWEP